MSTTLVTGGAGFIGSNFLRLVVPRYPDRLFINLDRLSYAGSPGSVESLVSSPNYRFVKADLAEKEEVERVFTEYAPDRVFHFAAETHVDRSIRDPAAFVRSNILGTFHLLEACRHRWADSKPSGTGRAGDSSRLFHHVSTDEVYGSLDGKEAFHENSPYRPSSPYSATKAASDHLVQAYHRTYGLPVTITHCSNNYGPYQFPEKLIPLMILQAVAHRPLPVYGDGGHIRDWLYVEDHCEAILRISEMGRIGESYGIGGDCERRNLDVVRAICRSVAEETGRPPEDLESLIRFVPDRPGHDRRYAIDTTRIRTETGWAPNETLETGLRRTVRWYLDNDAWIRAVKSVEHDRWLETQYGSI